MRKHDLQAADLTPDLRHQHHPRGKTVDGAYISRRNGYLRKNKNIWERQKDFGSIVTFVGLTTRNRTKDTLMSANHYSQMLCQLSYGEGFLPSDAPIPAGHGPPLQVPAPENPLPWAHVIPANHAPCPPPLRTRGCDPDARLPRRQGEGLPSWRHDLGPSAHSAGTLQAPLHTACSTTSPPPGAHAAPASWATPSCTPNPRRACQDSFAVNWFRGKTSVSAASKSSSIFRTRRARI